MLHAAENLSQTNEEQPSVMRMKLETTLRSLCRSAFYSKYGCPRIHPSILARGARLCTLPPGLITWPETSSTIRATNRGRPAIKFADWSAAWHSQGSLLGKQPEAGEQTTWREAAARSLASNLPAEQGTASFKEGATDGTVEFASYSSSPTEAKALSIRSFLELVIEKDLDYVEF